LGVNPSDQPVVEKTSFGSAGNMVSGKEKLFPADGLPLFLSLIFDMNYLLNIP